MFISIILLILIILSFIFALRSMRDFEIPLEIKRLMKFKRIQGTIVFLRDKIKHYRAKLD